MKCLITEKFNQEGIDMLKERFEVTIAYDKTYEELLAMIPEYEILVVRAATNVDKKFIEAGKKLKVIGMAGIGLNHIDLDQAKAQNIEIFNVPDGSIGSVAELTIGMMITVMRQVYQCYKFVQGGNWDKTAFIGNLIEGKTVGILSLGRIGFRVAELARAFGANIITFDPYVKKEIADKVGAEIVELDEFFKKADIVSVHTPLTDETYHMVGEKQLAQMKKGSYIFNLGRGGIVDEDALYDSLKSGHIAGAGFDVLEVEEQGVRSKLLDLENFVLTCHIGAGSQEAQKYIAESLAGKILNFL